MKPGFDSKKAGVAVALLILGVLFGVLGPRHVQFLAAAENWVADLRVAMLTPDTGELHPDIVILEITENELSKLPYRSPLDRQYLAKLIAAMAGAGAKAMGLDILFDQPTEAEKDDLLRQVMLQAPMPVITGWTDRATGLTEKQYAYQIAFLKDVRAGYSNVRTDAVDHTVRTIFPGRHDAGGAYRPSWVGVIAQSVGVEPPKQVNRLVYRAWGKGKLGFKSFDATAAMALARFKKEWFKDKIILLGANLLFEDRHRTPFSAVREGRDGTLAGIFVQANALAQVLAGVTPPEEELELEIAIVVVLSAISLALTFLQMPVPVKAPAGFVVIGGLWGGAFWLFGHNGTLLPVVSPTLAFLFVGGLGSAYLAREQRKQVEFIRNAFSHFVSPDVVKRFEKDPQSLSLGGEKRQVTIVFTDVASFSTMSEGMEPTALVALMNEYLDAMSGIVLDHGGMIDKYIGDALMAVFSAPEEQSDHAARAVACALELDRVGSAFSADKQAQGIPFGITRIGLHTGEAVVGNIGGSRRFDYTAIGDMVNTAARLEGANKYFGTRICLSQETAERCGGDTLFRPIGAVVVKGKTEATTLFEPVRSEDTERADAYRAAYAMMKAGEAASLSAFEDVAKRFPGDPLCAYHIERIQNGDNNDRIKLEGK